MAFNEQCNVGMTPNYEDYDAEWEESVIEDKLSSRIFRDGITKWASLTRSLVKFVANLCQALHYSPEIEFTAYNTVDMFFAKCFAKIRSGQRQFDFNWSGPEVILKIFNIIMICAKHCSQYALVPLEEIVAMLRQVGCQCDVATLKVSEVHVFGMIDYEIYRPVAFEAVHFVVSRVFRENNAKVKRLMDVCVLLMRFTFLERETILIKINEAGVELSKNFELNERFLAAIVVITGAKIVKLSENDYMLLIEAVHLYLKIVKREVFRFSNVLFQLIMNENTNNIF